MSAHRCAAGSVAVVFSVAVWAVGIVGPQASADPNGLVPMQVWYNPELGDYFSTTHPAWTPNPASPTSIRIGYRYVGVRGLVFDPARPQPPDTLPLFGWYSPSRGDNFVTTNPSWAGPADPKIGYHFVRLEGYVYDRPVAGTAPLVLWFAPSLGDNHTTADPTWSERTRHGAEGYNLVGVQGYVVPGPPSPNDPVGPRTFGYGRAVIEGDRPLLLIMVDFPRLTFRAPHTSSYYSRILFGPDEPNVSSYFRDVSNGRFTFHPAGPGVIGPVTIRFGLGTANSGRQAIAAAAEDGLFDFRAYDVNPRDGVVSRRELAIELVTAAPLNVVGGQTSDLVGCLFALLPTCLDASVSSVDEGSFMDNFAHELVHQIGAGVEEDLYGSDLGNGGSVCHSSFATLMSCTLRAEPATLTAALNPYHLDPWHKIQFGWIRPRIEPISNTGSCGILDAQQFDSVEGNLRPIIFYDPAVGTSRYFIAEFRTPSSSIGPGYDASVADTGVAIWSIRTGADGSISHIRGVSIIPGDDRTLETNVVAGADQPKDFQSDGILDAIWAGPDGILDTRKAPTDAYGDDAADFLVGAPNAIRGVSSFWTQANGEFDLRIGNDPWLTPEGGIRFRVGPLPALRQASVALEWTTKDAFVPRLDLLRSAATVTTGSMVAVDGVFGAQQLSRTLSLRGETGVVYDLQVEGWSCGRVTATIPTDVPPGEYDLVAFAGPDHAQGGNSIPLAVTA